MRQLNATQFQIIYSFLNIYQMSNWIVLSFTSCEYLFDWILMDYACCNDNGLDVKFRLFISPLLCIIILYFRWLYYTWCYVLDWLCVPESNPWTMNKKRNTNDLSIHCNEIHVIFTPNNIILNNWYVPVFVQIIAFVLHLKRHCLHRISQKTFC